jgi:hypothetical protein
MVKDLPKHTLKPKLYLVSILGGEHPVEKLVKAKTQQGAITFVAKQFIEAILPDGDALFKMYQQGMTIEDATQEAPDLVDAVNASADPGADPRDGGDATQPEKPKRKR